MFILFVFHFFLGGGGIFNTIKNRVNVINGPLENSVKLEKSQFMTHLINYATVFCVKYASDG